jgi:hypothetical protein
VSVAPLLAALFLAPPASDLLHGPTEVKVAPVAGAHRIELFLDTYPAPFCRLPGAGGTCTFDAGSGFEPHRLRAQAQDAGGRRVAEDVLDTRAFPAPLRVEARSLLVPVVADAPFAAADLTCLLGKEPCRVVDVLPPTDPRVPPPAISILVDVSQSMQADRRLLRDSLLDLVRWLTARATVSLAKFSGAYAEIVPPTRDPEALRAAVEALDTEGATCLWLALGRALDALAARPGMRVLLLVSDGVESCDPLSSDLPPQAGIGAIRRSGARLYVFRAGHFSNARALESLALESGGRAFGRGGYLGLAEALAALMEDLGRTYVVDLAPGPAYREGDRLTLRHRQGKRIVAPVYAPATAEQRDLTALAAARGDARREPAARLAEVPSRAALRGIARAFDEEGDPGLLDPLARSAAALLLHGTSREQDAALDAAERLADRGIALPDLLAAALRVFPEASGDRRLVRRAREIGR